MKRILLPLILVLALSAPHLISAQVPFFKKTKAEAEIINLGYTQKSREAVKRYLEVLAEANNTGTTQIRLIVAYEKILKLTRKLNNEMQVVAKLNNLDMEGDTQFMGFDLSEVLRPSAVDFRLALKKDGNITQTFDYKDVLLKDNPVLLDRFMATDSTLELEKNKLVLRNLSFVFTRQDQRRFDRRVRLIQEYYSASQDLQNLFNELSLIRPDDLDGLEAQSRRLQNLDQQVGSISQRNYENDLQLGPQNDPAQYVPRLRDSQRLIAELKTQIAHTRQNLHALYYDRGLFRLGQGERGLAVADFNKSLQLVPAFVPAHLRLANIAIEDGNVPDARARLIDVLTRMNPDPTLRPEALGMLRQILGGEVQSARTLVNQGKFAQGLEVLAPALGLALDLPDLGMANEVQQLATRAHQGTYQALLADARTKMTNGDFDLAERLANGALQYQQQNAAFLPDGSEAVQALKGIRYKLYQSLVQEAIQLVDQRQLDQAQAKVDQALSLGNQFPDAITNTQDAQQLNNRIQGERYVILIGEGKDNLNNRRYRDAVLKLEEARKIESTFNVNRDPQLWTLLQNSARGLIELDLIEARNAAERNDLEQARKMAQEATTMMTRYELQADEQLQALSDNLKGSILNQECLNAQARFDSKVAEARQKESIRQFIDAEAAYLKAQNIARKNATCGIDVQEVNNRMLDIAPAVAYQKQMVDAGDQVDRAMYRNAIQSHLNAGQAHQQDGLNKYGLVHPSLYDYVQASGRTGFMLYSTDYFTNEGELENAVELARILTRRGVSKFEFKPVQLHLGAELARRDYDQNPSGNPKVLAQRYTRGNKALKFIYKGYKKQWKRM